MTSKVENAYRYALRDQRAVHDALMARAEAKVKERVDNGVAQFRDRIGAVRDSWLYHIGQYMSPQMPEALVSPQTHRLMKDGDFPDGFLRSYLLDYHLFVDSSVRVWPLFDTVISWTYTWDTKHGYVVLHLPITVRAEDLVGGSEELLEPFSYNGVVGETDSLTVSAKKVEKTWERVVGDSSFGYAGATAQLSGFELRRAFGLV